MTARQLIAQLAQYQPDATVTLGTPYGAFEVGRVELENAFASDHAVAIVAGEVAGEGKDYGPSAQDVAVETSDGGYVPTDDDARERAHEALCRFIFPGYVVPRTEMVQSVIDALAGGDWRAKLPARRAAIGGGPARHANASQAELAPNPNGAP